MATRSKVIKGWQITRGARREDRHGVRLSWARHNGRVNGVCLGYARSYLTVFRIPRRLARS